MIVNKLVVQRCNEKYYITHNTNAILLLQYSSRGKICILDTCFLSTLLKACLIYWKFYFSSCFRHTWNWLQTMCTYWSKQLFHKSHLMHVATISRPCPWRSTTEQAHLVDFLPYLKHYLRFTHLFIMLTLYCKLNK